MSTNRGIVEVARLYPAHSQEVTVYLMCQACFREFMVDRANLDVVTRCPFCGHVRT